MSRVTPTEVKAIIDTDLADPIVQTWIDAASAVVDDNAGCMGSVETLLTQVELYLSAHFLALLDPSEGGIVTKEKAEQLETNYKTADINKNIDATVYGQTANMLSKGCLGTTSDKAIQLFSVGGSCVEFS